MNVVHHVHAHWGTFAAACISRVPQYVNPEVYVERWTGPDGVVSAIQLNNSAW